MTLDVSALFQTGDVVNNLPVEVRKTLGQAALLHTAQEVEYAVDQMAVQITVLLQDQDPVMLGVLQDGLVLACMLLQRMVFPMQTGFLSVLSHAQKTEPDFSDWSDLQCPDLHGKTVLLVDSVVAHGRKIAALIAWLQRQGARQVVVAVMVEKLVERATGISVDFSGLKIVDKCLVGYGMDYAGYGRNLPGIYAVGS